MRSQTIGCAFWEAFWVRGGIPSVESHEAKLAWVQSKSGSMGSVDPTLPLWFPCSAFYSQVVSVSVRVGSLPLSLSS